MKIFQYNLQHVQVVMTRFMAFSPMFLVLGPFNQTLYHETYRASHEQGSARYSALIWTAEATGCVVHLLCGAFAKSHVMVNSWSQGYVRKYALHLVFPFLQ
ncbi:hypothetical protein BU24DRAFT_23102 [Aaosphaeria arxii CBS 175.79]|uniref:Uncharacterized protein n=1 Tax=Aaosphaeria arxii CBS 175.79 TaxID=1450172 RepID=A0A6A5Y8D5_9PLEO|nr:uncharacterized protein BU24DRAFT_23102 [Aaosphaeria arxii CBS 175.79]KAF2021576.1 hypothetical protein BU24DRAFT_23102 [Aaosphaeria arxii CBS 175.79]